MQKADYSKIASIYDRGRWLSSENLNFWLNSVSNIIGKRENIKLLDMGCGTGRFAVPFAYQFGYTVTGADVSEEMLEKAREKDKKSLVKWDKQNAESLTYRDDAFDVVFISHLLHHIDNPLDVLKECYRVLRKGGIVINRYGAREDIIDDPEHRFFPEAVEIDKKRVYSKEQMVIWFTQAGFKNIKTRTTNQISIDNPMVRYERDKLKPTSVLTLISDKGFKKGMEGMRRYIKDNLHDPWLLCDVLTLTYGIVKK